MYERMRRWSRVRRSVVLFAVAVGSWVFRHTVVLAIDSEPIRLAVSLVMLALLGWLVVTYFRVLLKEGEEAAKKNPRPW